MFSTVAFSYKLDGSRTNLQSFFVTKLTSNALKGNIKSLPKNKENLYS